MMEFTLSRVCLSVCGLVLLAAIIVPVTGMFESKTMNMESDIPDGIGSLIDDFYYSEMEVFTVSMADVLPNTSSYVEFSRYHITLTTERGTYHGGTNVIVVTGNDGLFEYNDIIKLTKYKKIVIAQKLGYETELDLSEYEEKEEEITEEEANIEVTEEREEKQEEEKKEEPKKEEPKKEEPKKEEPKKEEPKKETPPPAPVPPPAPAPAKKSLWGSFVSGVTNGVNTVAKGLSKIWPF